MKLLFVVSTPSAKLKAGQLKLTSRFVPKSVENHEGNLKILAKSVHQIAVRLPRIKIQSMLYPTQQMRLAVESLYSCILEFLLRAHMWINESKLRHLYHSITQPHALHYDDLLERIKDCSKDVLELADVGLQAETRAMHRMSSHKLDEIGSKVLATDTKIQGLACAISRVNNLTRDLKEQLDIVVPLVRGSDQMRNDILLKMEGKYYEAGRRTSGTC